MKDKSDRSTRRDPLSMRLLCCAVAALLSVCLADITGTNPPNGSCLCMTHRGVRVRDPACGTVIGSANTNQCFTYKGRKEICNIGQTTWEFFLVDYMGRDGWMAGNFMALSPGSRCGTGGIGGYQCPTSDQGRRIHEMTRPTPYDCRDLGCGNTCHGGQCVAYVTCRCTHPGTGHHPPGTSCWRPGVKAALPDGRCNSAIPVGTAIATFNSAGRYYAGHTGVFMGCVDDFTLRMYDQWCCRSIGYTNYRLGGVHYNNYYVLENPGVCPDRTYWPCRSEGTGPTCCPVSVPGCKRRAYWYDTYGRDQEPDEEESDGTKRG